MIKTLAFIVRRPDIERVAFRDHYETRHVPLALPLLPTLRKYVRNHVVDAEPGFDCLTEFWYPDRTALEDVMATLQGDAGAPVREDERRFMDKPNNIFCAGEEELLVGPDRETDVGAATKLIVLARRRSGSSADVLKRELSSRLCDAEDLLRATAHSTSSLSDSEPPWDAVVELWRCPDAKPFAAAADLASLTERLAVCPVLELETRLSESPDR